MKIEQIHFETIGSTNTWAKENAHTFDQNALTIVTADTQTAGRGRFKRTWESPPGMNIYATYCFFTSYLSLEIMNISQVLPLSAVKMLESIGLSPVLKWPNDILLSEKKMGGILCETTSIDSKFCVILGIGINVNMPIELLKKIDRPATSIFVETDQKFDVLTLKKSLAHYFSSDLELFLNKGFQPFYARYHEKLHIRSDRLVEFHDGKEVCKGYLQSVNFDGSLNFIKISGENCKFYSGEYFNIL